MVQRRSRGCWEPARCPHGTNWSLHLELSHKTPPRPPWHSSLLLLLHTDTNHGTPGTSKSLFARLHVPRWVTSVSLAGIFFLLLHTLGLRATRQGSNYFDDEIHITNFFGGLMTHKIWKQGSSRYCLLPLLFSVYWAPTSDGADCSVPRMQKGIETKERIR